MKFRPLLSIEKMQQISAQKDSHCAQAGKQDRKGKTDLPHQLKRLVCIIPHIPVHDLIHEYPCDKLTGSHENRAPDHLFPQGRTPSGPYALLGKKYKADASQQEHGPVGESPEDHLERIIERSAQSSQK